jgi:hypothetical protein
MLKVNSHDCSVPHLLHFQPKDSLTLTLQKGPTGQSVIVTNALQNSLFNGFLDLQRNAEKICMYGFFARKAEV